VLCALALGPLALTAGGCGFRPRGSAPLPFSTFHTALPQTAPLGGELRRAVRNQGVRIVERRDDAQVRFDLLGESIEREISALSLTGRPREFLLRYRIRWQVKGMAEQELIPPTEMVLTRPIAVLDAQGLVNGDEEALLFRDMRNDAATQIVRRMSVLKVPT
jgi:LPS-assembly lipoprotein